MLRAFARLRHLLMTMVAIVAVACTVGESANTTEDASAGERPPGVDLWDGVPPIAPRADDRTTRLTPRPGPALPKTLDDVQTLPFDPDSSVDTDDTPAAPSTAPLALERFGPKGPQGVVDAVRVTFSQAMVPLAAIEDLDAKITPITIDPPIAGRSQWLGTRTIAYRVDDRFPFSTRYTVTVPGGTHSVTGVEIARAVSWSFSTPTLELTGSSLSDGSDGVDLEPSFVLTFNQAVQHVPLLAALRLRGGGHTVDLTPVAAPAGEQPEAWQAARTVRVRPKVPLRPNTAYVLEVPAGVYGEGPVASRAIRLRFHTYRPLRVAMGSCGRSVCPADWGITLTATNAIADPKLPERVHVEPKVERLEVSSGWNGISLRGNFAGGTTYTITVDPELSDTFGQKLARPFRGRVRLGPPQARLSAVANRSSPLVIERGAPRSLLVRAAGLRTLEARGIRVANTDPLTPYLHRYVPSELEWPPVPSFTTEIDVSASLRRQQPFSVDLDALLGGRIGDPGLAWIALRSEPLRERGYTWRRNLSQFVAVTDLGITAALGGHDRPCGTRCGEIGGVVLVTRLSDGSPVLGAEVEILGSEGNLGWRGTTDTLGQAYPRVDGTDTAAIVAREGDDRSVLAVRDADLRGRWFDPGRAEDRPRAFIFTDRQPYKPGDTVHVAGVLRLEEFGPFGAITGWRKGVTATYKVVTPRGLDVAEGEVKIDPFGSFTVDIPTTPAHGTGNFQFTLSVSSWFQADETFSHAIPIESYRAPEFEVAIARPASKPLVFGDILLADIKASYLHGAPMIGATVNYVLRRRDSNFRPPGPANEAFTFGRGGATWRGREVGEDSYYAPYAGAVLASKSGRTTRSGTLRIDHFLDQTASKPPGADRASHAPELGPSAATYSIDATVTDENLQAIASHADFVVHPALVYPGIRADRFVAREGETIGIEAITTDLAGERLRGQPLAIDLIRRVTTAKPVENHGRWIVEYETQDEPSGHCELKSDAGPVRCELKLGKSGTYIARASTRDANARPNRSELQIYVHGEDSVVWDQDHHRVDLVPDRREYEPGNRATILVRSPFSDGRGIVVVEREGIARHIPVIVEGGSATVEIPITASMIPRVRVSAVITRPRTKIAGAPADEDLGRPAAAAGEVTLAVSSDSKAIVVELEPDAPEIEPNQTLELTIRTKSSDGTAHAAALAVMVVDEGVLSLMNYKTPDPLAFFHRERRGGVWLSALHPHVAPRHSEAEPSDPSASAEQPEAEEPLADREGSWEDKHSAASPVPAGVRAETKPKRALAGDEAHYLQSNADASARRDRLGGRMQAATDVSLRTLFATTAYFNADVRTDASGMATVSIPMPENLTTFRIMAIAIDPEHDDRFGSADTTVRVRKALMLRPSLPRFLNFGDAFEAAVMVDNQTGADQSVLVGTRGTGVELTGPDRQIVDVVAGESKVVRFGMKTEHVGTMRLQFAALSAAGRDATEVTLPVHYPATAEAFADYGVTESSVGRLVEPPTGALAGFGGLSIDLSSTALSGLRDAVEYLVDYEYECAEQTASRLLPIFALGDILHDFPNASLADGQSRRSLAEAGIAKLLEKQAHDGGFGYWKSDESWPYVTNWVTFALLEGKRAGFAVDDDRLQQALGYVENFVRRGHRTRWGDYYDWTSRAFGLWLLSREGRGSDLFDSVWRHADDVPLYARALLMSAADRYKRTGPRDAVLEQLRASVVEGARAVHFSESTSEVASEGLRVLMHSDVQTDAIVLLALLEVAEADPLVPKVLAGIMDERDPKRGGRWSTTHANAWALLAAADYYRKHEAIEPSYVARMWLDAEFAGEVSFRGRTMAQANEHVPMATLLGAPTRQLSLAKDGPGRLYYRIGLRYANADLSVAARDQGFVVYRTYEPIGSGDATPDPSAVVRGDDGSWQIKAGTAVKVTLNVVARDRSNYVVIDDALPAGFEGQNPRFVTSVAPTQSTTREPGPHRWWWPRWQFDHTEMRDDRMLLFADHLPAGVYTYSYTARATAIGTFVLPPVRAEAMYEPERFGHSASSVVRIVE